MQLQRSFMLQLSSTAPVVGLTEHFGGRGLDDQMNSISETRTRHVCSPRQRNMTSRTADQANVILNN